jgi:hypothetical protein
VSPPESAPADPDGAGRASGATGGGAGRAGRAAGPRLAAILLAAACVAWTATPLLRPGWATFALVVAIIAATASALRLALSDVPLPENDYFQPPPVRAWLTFLALLRTVPWEEIAVIALLWLEVQHPARPWPTAALGAGLTGYLLAVHIAESSASTGLLLRRQAKVLVAGACLLALGAGIATLPAVGPGAGSAVLRLLAAVAVVAAAVLVFPG